MTSFTSFELFGEEGEVLLFAPANGYPPRTYQKFIAQLTPRYRVLALKHRPLWPRSRPEDIDDWHDIAQDTLTFLAQRNIRQIIGIGHSLGAVTNLLAAAKEPDRFRALVLIEPVVLSPALSRLHQMTPARLRRRNPMVKVALNRRFEWESREAAFAHFRSKSVFSRWSDEILWDFVNFGLVETGANGTVTLVYSREWEAKIYSTVARVWPSLPQLQQMPTLGLRGGLSQTISPNAWKKWQQKQPAARLMDMEGVGHMVPMEQPAELAQIILDFLDELPAVEIEKDVDHDAASLAETVAL